MEIIRRYRPVKTCPGWRYIPQCKVYIL